MNAPVKLSKLDELRARDGDVCWLCAGRLDFSAVPNSGKAPTREHLVAVSRGGPDTLDNLVLCHPGCNKQLGNRPLADKLKMREKKVVARERQRFKSVGTTLPTAPAVSRLVASESSSHQTLLSRWRMIAIATMTLAAFATGLAVGVIIAR